MSRCPKLLFVVTEDWYFVSHRLPLALAAQKAGFDVVVATREGEHGERIRAEGIRLIPCHLSRRRGKKLPCSRACIGGSGRTSCITSH